MAQAGGHVAHPGGYDALHQAPAQKTGREKVDPGPHGQADARIGKSLGRPKKIPSDKSGGFPGDGRQDDLQQLYGHENQRTIGAGCIDKRFGFFPVQHQMGEGGERMADGITIEKAPKAGYQDDKRHGERTP